MYILEIQIDSSIPLDLKSYYENYSNTNKDDSGIDLVVPYDLTIKLCEQKTINFGIKCNMKQIIKQPNNIFLKDVGYTLHPRSSISKTPLMMANSTGIIDAGYRGYIMAKVLHVLKRTEKKSVLELIAEDNDYVLKKGTKLFQIVSPDLSPISVKVVDKLSETTRGEGGFGSTGTSI